jgi:hypothetical protein
LRKIKQDFFLLLFSSFVLLEMEPNITIITENLKFSLLKFLKGEHFPKKGKVYILKYQKIEIEGLFFFALPRI